MRFWGDSLLPSHDLRGRERRSSGLVALGQIEDEEGRERMVSRHGFEVECIQKMQ